MPKIGYEKLKDEYQFIVPALNRRASRKRLRPGELSLCEGVDGRYTGGFIPHPGMEHLTTISAGTVVKFWYMSVQKGSTAYNLRGFLVLYLDGTYKLAFHYYDEDPGRAAWESYVFTGLDTLDATQLVSVDGSAKFAYVAIDGQTPQVLYNTAAGAADASAAFSQKDMGPGAVFDSIGDTGLAAPTFDSEDIAGYLTEGLIYSMAYRFLDSTRGIKSAMSATLTHTVVVDDTVTVITNPYAADLDAAWDQGYDKLQIFRSLSANIVGSSYEAGYFYLEKTYDLDSGADCWPAAVLVGTVRDEELLFVEVYDPIRDISGSPPEGGAIISHEGVTFMGSSADGGSVVAQLQWTPLHEDNPEVFPVTGHSHIWSTLDGRVKRFVKAGDSLYAFTDSASYRIIKSGAQLMLSRMQGGRSIVSAEAVSELGRDAIGVTRLGVSIFDGATGALQTVGALDRVIFDDWEATLASVTVATDAKTGATYICNLDSTIQRAAIVWHVTGAVSELDDMNFVAAAEGPDPTAGGVSRAWFITSAGRIVRPAESPVATRTMMGVPTNVSVDELATGGSTTTLVMSGAANWTDANLVGSKVYIWYASDDANTAPTEAVITGTTGGNTLDFAAITTAPGSGDRFSISPVPFRVRAWPIRSAGSPAQFGRKVVRSMGVDVSDLSGHSDNPNAKWTLGACRNLEARPTGGTKFATMDADAHDQFAQVAVDGIVIEPYLEHISAETKFELLSLAVDIKVSDSRKLG